MRINNNLMAMNTHRAMGMSQQGAANSIAKLSTGQRINKAADDAAGLSISEKMRSQIRGLNQASRNAQDGINLLQTAEGGLTETTDILQRMRELAVQSSNGTLTKEDRSAIDAETKQLKTEIDRISDTTEFNNTQLLNGSLEGAGGGEGVEVTGAAVFKGTKGTYQVTSASVVTTFKGSAIDLSLNDSLIIDGSRIDIEWSKLLTEEEKDAIKSISTDTALTTAESKIIRDIMETGINRAIDESGTGASYIDITELGTGTATGTFQFESQEKGSDSEVRLYHGIASATSAASLADGATVLVGSNSLFGKALGTSAENSTATVTVGSWETTIAITAGANFDVSYNGQNFKATMDVSGGSGNSALQTTGTSVSALADAFETAINNSISALNTATSASVGDEKYLEEVIVQVTDDGRLEIQGPSGDLILTESEGQTILDDQGLSSTAVEAAGQGAMTFQIGANKNQDMSISIKDMSSSALGISGVNVSTQTSAQAAIDRIESAITKVSTERGKIGAVQNRLEHTIKNLDTSAENLQASEAQIRDVDMAKEMMQFTKNNILTQAAQSMMAQANQSTQGVLGLLR